MEEKSLAEMNSKFVIHSGYLVLISIFALVSTILSGGVSGLALMSGLLVGLLWSLVLPIFWRKGWFFAHVLFTTWSAIAIGNWVAIDDLLWPTFQYLSLVFLVASIVWFVAKRRFLAYLG
jgi:hypothetical protein